MFTFLLSPHLYMRSYLDTLGSASVLSLVPVVYSFSFESYTGIPVHHCPVDSVF